jgi:hypothetical protein
MKLMTKHFLLITIFCFCSFLGFTQTVEKTTQPQLTLLSSKQMFELSSLPELHLPASYKNKSIPYEVDNTLQSCYGGLFDQSGLCCGQAACVGNGFTYEMNRVRNTNGTVVANKYPTHFAWNWENGGDGYSGASYYHSMIMLRTVGIPNMQTYGGTHDFGGATRFMTGYDAYYEGMQNRISKAYAIRCDTEEGILTLKNWINDHLEGSDVGGIGFFYSQHQNPSTTLPAGTEHAGEKIVTSWGASPNHAMTITGYNDSIKWDYNGDGQYTNDIDLNDDDIIDVRDWEIGGFKMCNTYGGAYNGWMMYRTLALASSAGGIWNNTVNVLYAIEDYSPMLTAKVRIYYTNRKRIKILAGMSTNLSATEPDYYMTFPIVDYQGAEWGMQGASDEASREIELGLDISPFLNIVPSGTPTKFFFQVHESDDDGWGTGQIKNFSVINYSSGSPVEYTSSDLDVAIIQNGVTTVSVNHTPVFAKPEITTDVLPNANVYHDYSHQMLAENGTAPYRWEFDVDYSMTETATALPLATTPLTGSMINLPFDFPFYGETFNYFYLNTRGLIDFSGESYSLPYNSNALSNYSVRFMNRKCIGAFFSTTDCSAFYTSGPDYYIIRWTGTNIDVSLKLESNGNVTIFYNNCSPTNAQVWSSGISYGDLSNFLLTPYSGATTTISTIGYAFSPMPFPEIFSLSEDGLLTGVPTEEILAYPLNFKVTDAKGMIDRKTVPISTEGLIVGYDITTPNNTTIEWGESVDMNLNLRNATESTINNLVLTITCSDPDVNVIDGTQSVGQMDPLEEINVAAAFNFDLNYNFYNEQEITFHLIAECDENSWEFDIVYPVYTADVDVEEYFVEDADNNRLDIGETSDVYYVFSNTGGASVDDVTISVSSSDPFFTINGNSDDIGNMLAGQSSNAYFNFTAHADCLPGHVAILNFHVSGANGYEKDIVGYISIGQILETWETNTMDTYSWATGGNLPWYITDVSPYEGVYCLKSGAITHNQTSTIEVELQVISAGSISFFRKVSSEVNYDFLKFYIDGIEKGSWNGEQDWALESYNVAAGTRNFKWVYSKDESVNTASDCAWVDFIEFPSIYDAEPLLIISHTEVSKSMYQDQTDSDTIYISNLGGGIIDYEIEILSDVPWLRNQRSIAGSVMTCSGNSFYAGDTVEWNFTAKNNGTDNEWVEGISMTFPSGFIVDSLTHYFDQSEDTLLLVSGVPGDGGVFSWFGEQTDGWGLIHGGETATSRINAHISEDFEENLTVYYTIQGEIYGAEPHVVNDSLVFTNFGPRINWVSTESNSGSLGIGSEDEIILNFSSFGLSPGVYSCNLKVFASTDTVVIPVTLTVLNPVGIVELNSNVISVFPNPAKTQICIKSDKEFSRILITNSLGQILIDRNVTEDLYYVDIRGLKPGVYFVNIYSDLEIHTKKIVVE